MNNTRLMELDMELHRCRRQRNALMAQPSSPARDAELADVSEEVRNIQRLIFAALTPAS